jgi:hypothetical protein
MKKSTPIRVTDEAIAFVLFLICCIISFFRHPAVADIAFTLAN